MGKCTNRHLFSCGGNRHGAKAPPARRDRRPWDSHSVLFRSSACSVGARKLRFCLVSAVSASQEMLASVFQTQMFVGLIFWVKFDHLFKCQKQKASSSAKCPGKCHL